jgi:peptidoglycan/LPS O-acetylase OafA/YrhL
MITGIKPLADLSPTSVKTITNHPYIGGLDGLRAIAALAVFVVHFQQFSNVGGSVGVFDFTQLMANGNTGVGLFFVLSGFLLSVPFWRELKAGTFPSIRDYMVNRMVRVIPIYYCCLLGILILNGHDNPDINTSNIVSHIFFLHNLQDAHVMSLNPPFWTLAVEFQFYLILPLIFLLFAKFRFTTARALCLISIPAVYLAYRFFMQSLEAYQNWPMETTLLGPIALSIASVKGNALIYSLFAHLPLFLIGMLGASFFSRPSARSSKNTNLAEAAFWTSVVLVFLILASPLDAQLQIDYGRYNFPFVPLLLGVIVFTTPQTRVAKRLLEWAPLKWLGVISYGLYILHWPIQQSSAQVLTWVDMNAQDNEVIFAIMSFVITVVCAHFTYLFIEAPILKRFKKKK